MLFDHKPQLPLLLTASIHLPYGFCRPQVHVDNIGHVKPSLHLDLGPIDAVYTWVNGSDPEWKVERDFWYQRWIQESDGSSRNSKAAPSMSVENDDGASDENHYRDNDELRYSIRSLEKYAPWIHQIYIVTNGQVPSWLDRDDPRVKIVTHSEIFENSSDLPVFSSSAIESNLDRIAGLSDYFLYFNDDVFLGAPVEPEDFVGPSGSQKIYLSHPVPLGDDAYPEYWSQNKHRDEDGNDSTHRRASNSPLVGNDCNEIAPEPLTGKVFLSAACDSDEAQAETLQMLLGNIIAESNPSANDQIGSGFKLLQSSQHPILSDLNPSNRTDQESELELDTTTRIKIAVLLDAFSQCPNDHDLVSEAIRSVIKAFNGRFNLSQHLRRVPAHMPHMIKKQTFTELKEIFKREFQQNSAHKFRHPRDVQVSFAYFDYLLNRPYFLSTLCRLENKNCDPSNSSSHSTQGYELKMATDVTFHMLGDDFESTMDKLDSTRQCPTKFICLNDDMKHQSADLEVALHGLLESLWPVPSSLELYTTPPEHQNRMKECQIQSSISTFWLLTFVSTSTAIIYLSLQTWIKLI
ncbi:uncharacterized protein N7483_012493 [Penicillium malachiteum]|uniref:uncharacterized protein n=1 Tax=Penicillium malachiteum TaxID=1324776 RepID=UPI002546F46B|nr:uncharacterized protein N7483_012493 [Penicillium malachiteum]KAJ5715312.1 hypothetical protein N7483_012493 [Penicillium malachiteum]